MQSIRIASLLCAGLLAGCSQVEGFGASGAGGSAGASAEAGAEAQSPARAAPPTGAASAEAFDTTSEEERAAAAAPGSAGDSALGTVVVSLGAPAEPGFWLETPLVDAVTPGRVELADGTSAQVELRPAPEGSGSRLSLPAMRLLGVALTDLPEVTVYTRAEGA
ncbi:D-galactarate dehydratase [Roseivivax sp. GX 12232]|uniref:D-galactarate dehydratase n=1 Tax=Roseivivax sp. GX 12232 TaxID=2900547 RepID=UPI001E515BBD|nr:D-galactarate dehydratase [Roseivivax sp. GX 12232]MCE0504294.1 D-galactarate dehydratase [Roseivivax sp. GX 12232]